MSPGLLALCALLPIILIVGLVYFQGMTSSHAVPLGCLLAVILALFVWQVSFLQIIASVCQGLFVAFEALLLLAFAIVLGRALKATQACSAIQSAFSRLHPDRRVQAILIAWSFGSGIESVLGFGPTGSISSLIMVGIGFPPACAIVMAVMGLATSSAFTLMGTPVLLGVGKGMQDPQFLSQLAANGLSMTDYLQSVTAQVGMIHGIVGVFQPLLMVMTMNRFFSPSRSWTHDILSIAPFALFAGLAFTVPYGLTAFYLGPEFPSLVGSVVGSILVVTALKISFLSPHQSWQFVPVNQWRRDWIGGIYAPPRSVSMSAGKAWLPFILLALCMVVSRLSPVADWLKSFVFQENNLWQTPISLSLEFLYLPAIISVVVILILAIIYPAVWELIHAGTTQIFVSVATITRKMPLAVAMAAIYTNSSVNNSGHPGMLQSITNWLAEMPGSPIFCLFLSPFIGAMGTFSPESGMFSNLELSMFQHHLGQSLGLSGTLFVALQVVGSSVGNLMAVNYISNAALSAVGTHGWEGDTFRRNLVPALIYLAIAGFVGVAIVYLV